MSAWTEIKSFSNLIQAELAKSALEQAGIEAHIQIDDPGRHVPLLATIRLLVDKEKVSEAKNLLRTFKD